MRSRFAIIFALVITLLLTLLPAPAATPAAAQPLSNWMVTLLDKETGALNFVTQQGISTGSTVPETVDFQQITRTELTPDGRYLVFNGIQYVQQSDGTQLFDHGLYVADLAARTCCRPLEADATAGHNIKRMGPLSPDGTQVVAMFLNDESMYTPGVLFQTQIGVIDIASGALVAMLPVHALSTSDGTPAPAAQFGKWDASGIRLIASCWGCEGVWEGNYQIWNPAANTLSAPIEPFDIFQNTLPATGEVLKTIENPAYPRSGAFSAYFPPANVVEYQAAVGAPSTVIAHDSRRSYILNAHWVADGNAILVHFAGDFAIGPGGYPEPQGDGTALVITRNGLNVVAPPPAQYSFLVGTPDGWLTRDQNSGIISRHVLSVNGVQSSALGSGGELIISQNYTMGATANGTFVALAPPQPIACSPTMAARLTPNSMARVTPGLPNNLRSAPGAGGAIIGEIPGEELFIVLEGPQCDNGIPWWQVNYQGNIGWTAEGQNGNYWLEPMTSF